MPLLATAPERQSVERTWDHRVAQLVCQVSCFSTLTSDAERGYFTR